MESLSSTYTDSYWSMDQQDLFTVPRSKAKTSDYETGFSAAEYDEDEEERSDKVAGKVNKVSIDEAYKLIVNYAAIVFCFKLVITRTTS